MEAAVIEYFSAGLIFSSASACVLKDEELLCAQSAHSCHKPVQSGGFITVATYEFKYNSILVLVLSTLMSNEPGWIRSSCSGEKV